MTSLIGNKQRAADRRGAGFGFTLIELILVMAMLVVVLAVSAPSLSNFFRGRHFDGEARRFLALTRLAQSRAVSEGLPMVLWIDTREGLYGLITAVGFTDLDTNAVEFLVDQRLRIEFSTPAVPITTSFTSETAELSSERTLIRFLPDGFITENSPDTIWFLEGENHAITIGRSPNRRQYEIQTNQPPYALR